MMDKKTLQEKQKEAMDEINEVLKKHNMTLTVNQLISVIPVPEEEK